MLADRTAPLLPPRARVLDVGSGDGRLASAIVCRRPDVSIQGIDVLVRAEAPIRIIRFDGTVIPLPDNSVDVVTLFDVLHHTEDPRVLLREATRVARRFILLKDHVCSDGLDSATLRFMDAIGNQRYGVALPYTFWSQHQWTTAIEELRLKRRLWQIGGLHLYPWPADLFFGRKLHVLALLEVTTSQR